MKKTIETFYTAFQELDAETMVSCYDDDIIFCDPAFGNLKGDQAKNMWRMLYHSQKGKDFTVTFSNIQMHGEKGSAHWEAFYTFRKTGRKVHNKIQAEFEFKNGKISSHTDHYNLHHWAGQAMGISGWCLGWTPFFKKKLQQQTRKLLSDFETRS